MFLVLVVVVFVIPLGIWGSGVPLSDNSTTIKESLSFSITFQPPHVQPLYLSFCIQVRERPTRSNAAGSAKLKKISHVPSPSSLRTSNRSVCRFVSRFESGRHGRTLQVLLQTIRRPPTAARSRRIIKVLFPHMCFLRFS